MYGVVSARAKPWVKGVGLVKFQGLDDFTSAFRKSCLDTYYQEQLMGFSS